MKILIHLTVLIAVLLIPTGCAKRETWDYLVMGVMSRAETSDIPEQFAAHIGEELGVEVVIYEQERWEPKEILENLRSNDDLRELVRDAEIITFDFHLEFLNAPEAKYSSKLCGGDDNQDCLREALAVEKKMSSPSWIFWLNCARSLLYYCACSSLTIITISFHCPMCQLRW